MAAATAVAIVGGGPYGLSVAAHLRARGIDFRIFGQPMHAWLRQMPAGMFLKSEGFASSLSDPQRGRTLAAYCADQGIDYTAPISLATFTDYGLSFQKDLVPELEQVDVVQLDRKMEWFELRLASGETVIAQQVVLAVGVGHFAYIPPLLAALPAALLSHTSHHHELTRFAGRDVTVIGGGQSALETAALLHEKGARVRVLMRKPKLRFHLPPVPSRRSLATRLRAPTAGLGLGWTNWLLEHAPVAVHFLPADMRVRMVHRLLGPCGAWWLKDRVLGRFPVMTSCSVLAATPAGDRVRLQVHQHDDGERREIVTDHIVAGTGYRVDLGRLPFVSSALQRGLRHLDGSPALSRHFESSLPGVYFAGLAAAYSFGPLLRFVLGVHATAPIIANRLAATSEQARRFLMPVSAVLPVTANTSDGP